MTERELIRSIIHRLDKMVCRTCKQTTDGIREKTNHATCQKIARLRDSARSELAAIPEVDFKDKMLNAIQDENFLIGIVHQDLNCIGATGIIAGEMKKLVESL